MDIIPQLLLQLFLIALNAVFACAEIAVISLSDAKTASLAEQGNKKALRLSKLKSDPARFLATIQVAITLSGFLGSAFAADNFAGYIVDALVKSGVSEFIPVSTLNTLSVIVITLLLSFITLVFGELVPKRIAMKHSEKIALGISSVVSFISKIFFPLVALLTVTTNAILRLFGINPNETGEEVTEDEIRMMVDAGSENGAIEPDERELIENVFEFDDLTANDIATHRTGITLLWANETPEQWDKTIRSSLHTFFPLCEDTVDNVIGVLSSKDYFRLADKNRKNILAKAVKPPYFVPESVKTNVLFKNMKRDRNHFAIVTDEYGGMSGIVTINDLLECIVGDLFIEEEAPKTPDIEVLDSKTWRISGSTPIEDVEEALELEFDCDCNTFAGYVLNFVGTIPDDGTQLTVESDELVIKVTKVKDHRIEKTIVTKKEPAPTEAEEKE